MSTPDPRAWLDLHRWRLGVVVILTSIVVTATTGGYLLTHVGTIALSIPPNFALLTPAGVGVGVALLTSYQVDLRSLPVGRARARTRHAAWLVGCLGLAMAVCASFGWSLEAIAGQGARHVATLANGMLLTGASLTISALGAPGMTWLPGAGLLAFAIVATPTGTATVGAFLSTAVSFDRVLYASLALGIGTVASIVSVGGSLGPLNRLDITS